MGPVRRQVQLVLLCEDRQQETFLRRFFTSMGWKGHQLRPRLSPLGKGSAEQFVREEFPKEIGAYRRNRNRVGCALVVMLDGDVGDVDARLTTLDEACNQASVAPRDNADRVAVFVPTWNIETWLAYLNGETVDENRKNYPRLPRERDCRSHVDSLVKMCREGRLREPSPPSLRSACQEYRTRIARPA